MSSFDHDRAPLQRLATSLAERVRSLDPELPPAELSRVRHLLEEAVTLLPAVDETASRRGFRSMVSGLKRTFANALEDEQDQEEAHAPLVDRRRDGFSGMGDCVGLPDILNFLGMLGKTGRLTVFAGSETMSIDFEMGKLVTAWSDKAPPGQRLGEILVAAKFLEQGRLDSFLTNYTRASGWLGEALEREGLVTHEELQQAVKIQTQQLFHRLFAAQSSWFTFTEGSLPRPEGVQPMNVNALLLESARQADERAA